MKASTIVLKLANFLALTYGLVLVLVPFHALFTTWIGSNYGHLDLLRLWKEVLVIASLPFVLWLLWLSGPAKKWLLHSWVVRLFAAYMVLHLVLGFWALSHHELNGTAFIYALIINLRFVGFFILCALVTAHSDILRRYWRQILLVPAVVVIIFGILQKFVLPYDFLKHFGYGSKTIPAYQTVDANLDYRRVQSTLRGANPLGAYLLLVITAQVMILRKNRITLGIYLTAALLLLFYSYSRSAELGLVLSLVFLAWMASKRWQWRWWTLGAISFLIIVGGSLFTLRSNQSFQDTLFHTSGSSTSAISSNAERLRSMENGTRDVINQPIGRGPGTAGPASFRNSGHPARIAEDYFLQIGQEVGILGMTLFIAINVIVGRGLWVRRSDQLAKVLLAGLVGLIFVNLVSHAWADDTLAYIWWGLAGVALATPAILTDRNYKHNGEDKQTTA